MFRKVLLMWQSIPILSFIGYTLTELFRKHDNLRQIYKETSLYFCTSNDVALKRVEKKKILRRHSKTISLKIYWGSHIYEMQKQPPEKFFKKAVFKNFAVFKGKHLCSSLFLIQSIAKLFRTPILKNICNACFWKRVHETEKN